MGTQRVTQNSQMSHYLDEHEKAPIESGSVDINKAKFLSSNIPKKFKKKNNVHNLEDNNIDSWYVPPMNNTESNELFPIHEAISKPQKPILVNGEEMVVESNNRTMQKAIISSKTSKC